MHGSKAFDLRNPNFQMSEFSEPSLGPKPCVKPTLGPKFFSQKRMYDTSLESPWREEFELPGARVF